MEIIINELHERLQEKLKNYFISEKLLNKNSIMYSYIPRRNQIHFYCNMGHVMIYSYKFNILINCSNFPYSNIWYSETEKFFKDTDFNYGDNAYYKNFERNLDEIVSFIDTLKFI